jgi:hypothetical protein
VEKKIISKLNDTQKKFHQPEHGYDIDAISLTNYIYIYNMYKKELYVLKAFLIIIMTLVALILCCQLCEILAIKIAKV